MRNLNSFGVGHFVIFYIQGGHFSEENDVDGLGPLNSGKNNGILVFSFITVTKCSVLFEKERAVSRCSKVCHVPLQHLSWHS